MRGPVVRRRETVNMLGQYLHFDEAETFLKSVRVAEEKERHRRELSPAESEEFFERIRRAERARREENAWYLHHPASDGPWPGLTDEQGEQR